MSNTLTPSAAGMASTDWLADPRWRAVYDRVTEIAAGFADQRAERQRRRELDPADFERLREAGFLLVGVPEALGGLWASAARSTRPICELLRTLAQGDPSAALVASMHPAVLAHWVATPAPPREFETDWRAQQRRVAQSVLDGAWWGTITSEPGSGGDTSKSTAVARPTGEPGRYLLSGQKHFGSGSGITSYMITTAVPEGEAEADTFFLDMRGVLDAQGAPRDVSTGLRLVAAWDGHGMTATQSHAFAFRDFPAERSAWPNSRQVSQEAIGRVSGCVFTAVVVGVVEAAFAAARRQLGRKKDSLRPYERVEWSRAELDEWLILQGYEGMLRAAETKPRPVRDILLGKTALAELAESVLLRLCRVLGGGTFSRSSPFGFWFEDVRALGFLRPPWGFAFDRLHEGAFEESNP